jgi:hypothetical protein
MFSDTPLPPEEPTGENPPDGAVIDYFLPADVASLGLEIWQGDRLIRRFDSADLPEALDSTLLPHPTYWIRPPQVLGTSQGMHRFVWDLRYAPPAARRSYPISAVLRDTASEPRGPLVAPGAYTVRLVADGAVHERDLMVTMDPRVGSPPAVISAQHDASVRALGLFRLVDIWRGAVMDAMQALDAPTPETLPATLLADSDRIRRELAALSGTGEPSASDLLYGSAYREAAGEETLLGTLESLMHLLAVFDSADAAPTRQALEALDYLDGLVEDARSRYLALADALDALSAARADLGLTPIPLPRTIDP